MSIGIRQVSVIHKTKILDGVDVRCATTFDGRLVHGVVWFDFLSLCRGARSSTDYLEIARFFHTVLLWRVPVMGDHDDDAARRFINLIDTLYDRNVRLFASADAPPESLYTGDRLNFEFQRTASRLREMQTHEYIALPHLA